MMLDALKWNDLNKVVRRRGDQKLGRVYVTPAKIDMLSREDCRQLIRTLSTCGWTRLSDIFTYFENVHVIQINETSWKRSHCTCYDNLKYHMCDHVIAISARLSISLID
jgi:hypothetical protein